MASASSQPGHSTLDETSPLLNNNHPIQREQALSGTPATTLLQDENLTKRTRRTRIYVFVIVNVFLILIELGNFISISPEVEILEGLICDDFYSHTHTRLSRSKHIDPVRRPYDCSIDAVQAELAIVTQLRATLTQIPGILLAVPYGILADRIGRKPVLMLAVFFLTVQEALVKVICWFPQTFPVRLVWATTVANVFGGGSQVVVSMFFTILADVVSAEYRTSAFSIIQSFVVITDMAGTSLAAYLTDRHGPWIPSLVSNILFAFAVLTILFLLPETKPTKPVDTTISSPPSPAADPEAGLVSSKPYTLRTRIRNTTSRALRSVSFISNDRNVLLIIAAFFPYFLASQSTNFLTQYIHKVLGWSFARASSVVSTVRGTTSLLSLLVLIPAASSLAIRVLHLTPASRDLVLSRLTLLLYTVGVLFVGLANSIHVFIVALALAAIGSGGAPVALRSLVTNLVQPTHVATLFTTLAVVQGIASVVTGPLLASTFKSGLKRGGKWIGLPWLVVGAFLALAIFAVAFVWLGHGGPEERAEDGAVDEPLLDRDGGVDDEREEATAAVDPRHSMLSRTLDDGRAP